MMILRNMVLMIATSIVLLHSIIPHSHHEDLTAEENLQEHETASSILDYLSLAFHLDHGDGQLEDFVPGNDLHSFQLDPFVPAQRTSIIEETLYPSSDHKFASYSNIYVDKSSTSSSGLRAPPSLS